MEELTLTTPSLLFSAVSLIMLAYTNRFLSYAQVVRTLKGDYDLHPTRITAAQIDNLRKRLSLIRTMQILGIVSLLLSVVYVSDLYRISDFCCGSFRYIIVMFDLFIGNFYRRDCYFGPCSRSAFK